MKNNSLELKNIKKFYGRKIVLSSISFSVKEGEFIAIIGPSGSGKTTLLNSLACITKIDEGDILIDNTSYLNYKNSRKLAKKIGVIRQQFDLIGELSVIHNVLVGRLSNWGLFKSLLSLIFPQDKNIAINALKRVGLLDKIYERTSNLSGGEQQRVAISRLIVQDPEIILADEPVSSLDPARSKDILELLKGIASENNKTFIASLHSVEYAREYFDRIIALKNGELYFDLAPNEINESILDELYSLSNKES